MASSLRLCFTIGNWRNSGFQTHNILAFSTGRLSCQLTFNTLYVCVSVSVHRSVVSRSDKGFIVNVYLCCLFLLWNTVSASPCGRPPAAQSFTPADSLPTAPE